MRFVVELEITPGEVRVLLPDGSDDVFDTRRENANEASRYLGGLARKLVEQQQAKLKAVADQL